MLAGLCLQRLKEESRAGRQPTFRILTPHTLLHHGPIEPMRIWRQKLEIPSRDFLTIQSRRRWLNAHLRVRWIAILLAAP